MTNRMMPSRRPLVCQAAGADRVVLKVQRAVVPKRPVRQLFVVQGYRSAICLPIRLTP